MTRKNHTPRGIVHFFGVLTVLLGVAALAQTKGERQGSATPHTDGAPDASSAGHVSANPVQVNILGTSPMAVTAPLFLPAVAYDPGGSYPVGVALADLNADGSLDIIVANANSGTVGVLLGNGHGWFEAPLTYNSSAHPLSVAIGDVNGDAMPDIVVATGASTDCGIRVLRGNGDGTFRAAVTYGSSTVCGAQSVVLADLNGDGKLDVAVSLDGSIAILLGNGDGSFPSAVTYGCCAGNEASEGSSSLAVADVNRDGKLDLIAATGNSNYPNGHGTVGVLLGNGDGTFEPKVDYDSGGGLHSYAYSLAVADLSGDGKPDIAVTNICITSLCGTVGVLLGNGDGTFQAAVLYGPGGLAPRSVVIADVNTDGKPDLVVASECASNTCTAGTVGILVGTGNGTFQPAVAYSSGGLDLGAAVADVNRDGKLDVVVTLPAQVRALLTTTGIVTKTVLTTSGSPTLIGQPVTFTATVTPSQGPIPDGELMAFYDGITMLGSEKLVSGMAAYTTSSLSAKTHAIKATYVGDAAFRLSNGGKQQAILKYSTTTTLSSSPNPSHSGQAVTFSVQVKSAGPTPTGSVKILDGTSTLGSATLKGGKATLTKSTLSVGTHPITAQYLGDGASAKSTSPIVNQVVQ